MGLNLCVGYLADLALHDEEAVVEVRDDFERLNQFLRGQGLPPHHEPETVKTFSCDMYGYSGLHYLRRIAAHLAAGRPLPAPGDSDASKDPLLAARYAEEPGGRSIFHRLFGRKRNSFEHLIQHSDAEGYYLPQDFPDVLVADPDQWKIPGALIGSSPRLLAECEALAGVLELPLHLNPDAEEVGLAPESQGKSEIKWKRYGVESFTCLRLHAAAKHSIATGAAVVFC
jgi:hypothetical protein